MMDRLRSRLSPMPSNGSAATPAFPTVLEESTNVSGEHRLNADGGEVVVDDKDLDSPIIETNPLLANLGYRRQLHRRRLPLLTSANEAVLSKSRSSRSFDSGISTLTSSATYRPSYSSYLTTASNTSPPDSASPPVTTTSPRSPLAVSGLTSRNVQRSMSMQQSSPTYNKSCGGRPTLFSSRRYSDNDASPTKTTASSRNLSPISVSKSPSPCYSSSKSGPESSGSPRNGSSSPGSPNNNNSNNNKSSSCSAHLPPSSPTLFRSGSRRMLPETPTRSSNVIRQQMYPPVSSYIQRGERTLAWQSTLSSHDSLDSGVYSRSTTSADSSSHYRAMSSPSGFNKPNLDTSPPLSWRRSYGSRLSEQPPPSHHHIINHHRQIHSNVVHQPHIHGHHPGDRHHYAHRQYSNNADSTSSLVDWESVSRRKSFPSSHYLDDDADDDDDLLEPPSGKYDYPMMGVPSVHMHSSSLLRNGNHHNHRVVHFDFERDDFSTSPASHLVLRSSTRSVPLPDVGGEPVDPVPGGGGGGRPSPVRPAALDTTSADLDDQEANLDVPKLKDLKSHSFPPPWARDSREEGDEEGDLNREESKNHPQHSPSSSSTASSSTTASSSFMEPAAPLSRLILTSSTVGCHDLPFSADERRRRWLQYSQTISESRYEPAYFTFHPLFRVTGSVLHELITAKGPPFLRT